MSEPSYRIRYVPIHAHTPYEALQRVLTLQEAHDFWKLGLHTGQVIIDELVDAEKKIWKKIT